MRTMKWNRRLVCMLLVAMIALTAFPAHVEAAQQVGKSMRTNAKIGRTYTYKCYYPGIGYVDMNATFKSFKNVKVSDSNYLAKKGIIRITMPQKTLNKIKNNVDKVVKAANSRNFQYADGLVLTYNDGKYATIDNSGVEFVMDPVYNKMKRYYKGNYSHNVMLSCDYNFYIMYPKSMKGKLLMGVAGSSTPIYSLTTKVYNFYYGKSSITATSYYSKKNKKLSIFYMF